MSHTVTAVSEQEPGWVVEYFDDTDTKKERGYGVLIPRNAVASRMGAYGLSDPHEALLYCIHEYHLAAVGEGSYRADPAARLGWVTSTEPDAEPIHLYNASSSREVAGAQKARMEEMMGTVDLKDPHGLLPDHTPAPEDVEYFRQHIDVIRWKNMYGDLPQPPLTDH